MLSIPFLRSLFCMAHNVIRGKTCFHAQTLTLLNSELSTNCNSIKLQMVLCTVNMFRVNCGLAHCVTQAHRIWSKQMNTRMKFENNRMSKLNVLQQWTTAYLYKTQSNHKSELKWFETSNVANFRFVETKSVNTFSNWIAQFRARAIYRLKLLLGWRLVWCNWSGSHWIFCHDLNHAYWNVVPFDLMP